MHRPALALLFPCAVALSALPTAAHAVMPVIDQAAVANLVRQVAYWRQQLAGMTSQLTQLQQTYTSMTGTRGMQNLLPMTAQQRNYLPTSYAELMNTVNANSMTYSGLSAQIQSAMTANAVLSSTQLASLTPEMRQLVETGRRSAAVAQAMSQAAYQNTSQRFAALQQLISMIGAAPDLKAIADLQGRVNAEQAMLTNEQTKLQTLAQMVQADEQMRMQRTREREINDIGTAHALPAVTY